MSRSRLQGTALWDELADVLDGRMSAHAANGVRTERWRVLSTEPLTVGQLLGQLVLEEEDPDLELTAWVKKYDEETGLQVGDVVLVHYSHEEYTVFDVVSD